MASLNATAQLLKQLHKSGKPLVLTNVYDRLSAQAVAKLPSSKALATASYAIAQANNTTDDDLDLETNLRQCALIADVAREYRKPLTVDIQDGYGDQLETAISRLVKIGVAGVNLEDYDNTAKKVFDANVAVDRIKRALATATKEGVADFVINARCDVLLHGGDLDEVISRGKAYLEAGATTVFVWGASRGVARKEVERLVKEFGGRLNVLLKFADDGLSIAQLADIGVARISIGPTLQIRAMDYYGKEADKLLSQV